MIFDDRLTCPSKDPQRDQRRVTQQALFSEVAFNLSTQPRHIPHFRRKRAHSHAECAAGMHVEKPEDPWLARLCVLRWAAGAFGATSIDDKKRSRFTVVSVLNP